MTDPVRPYRIETGLHRTINVSGGRSSGMMLHNILKAHDGVLPENCTAVFANTGKEMPQTLDFVAAMEREWNVRIWWLEYYFDHDAKGGVKNPKHCVRVVNHNSAGRNGESFAESIRQRKMLPNVAQRACTSELKVETVNRFVRRHLGFVPDHTRRVVGIRHDEPRRWRRMLSGDPDACQYEMPMVYAAVTREEVNAFWRAQPFDLDLAYDGSQSNCDLCFLKGKARLIRLIRANPHLADWWIAQEASVLKAAERRVTALAQTASFSQRHTYAELLELSRQPPDPSLPFEVDEAVDCACTD